VLYGLVCRSLRLIATFPGGLVQNSITPLESTNEVFRKLALLVIHFQLTVSGDNAPCSIRFANSLSTSAISAGPCSACKTVIVPAIINRQASSTLSRRDNSIAH